MKRKMNYKKTRQIFANFTQNANIAANSRIFKPYTTKAMRKAIEGIKFNWEKETGGGSKNE